VVLMDEGEIVADGRPGDVLDSSQARHLGIGLPPVSRLASALRVKGMWNDVLPVTLEEASARLGWMTEHAHERPRTHAVSRTDGIVAVDDLTYRYEEQQAAALSNVSVSLNHESVFAIMGRNGSGKTTLVKHFNGLLRPGSGVVKVDGRNVSDSTVAEMARTVGLVFQNPNDHLFADTVEEELAFTLTQQHLAPARIGARIAETCALFGLTSLRREHPRSLSGGERQRVALASVFAARPRVLVLDEPTRGMGAALKQELSAVLRDYSEKGNLVVVVTHDVETAVEQVDRVLLLANGKVDTCGDTRTALDGHPVFASQMNRLAKVLQINGGPVATVSDMLEVLT
ncbi:MAG: ATP-binding cassette domain-containing protein, partial [Chloroflexota bacterium]